MNAIRIFIIPAALTGLFCACFALAIDAALSMVSQVQVAVLAATSGFLGSIFSRLVLGRKMDVTDRSRGREEIE